MIDGSRLLSVGPGSLLRRPTAQVAFLIATALAVRVLALLSLARLPWFHLPNADSAVYDGMAKAFARGDLLIGVEPLRMSPAYPFFLGEVYRLLGDGAWPARIVHTMLGVTIVLLTWDTARELAGRRAAMIAGAIVALFGPSVFYEAQLLGEVPATALAALALWLMVRAVARNEMRASRWWLAGLATGTVALFRPNAIFLCVPLVGAALALPSGGMKRVILVTAAAFGVLVGLSPVPARNQLATGSPTLTAVHGGINLYVGNGPDATGTFRAPAELSQATDPDAQFKAFHDVAERAVGHPLGANAADRYWANRAISYVTDHPATWARLMLWKLTLYWNGRSISDIEPYDFIRSLNPVLNLPFIQWWALMPFALIGTVLAVRHRGPASVVGLFNLAWCCSVVMFFVVDRYRLPSLSGLAIAAALVVVEWREIWAGGSMLKQMMLASLVVIAFLVSWPVGVVDNVADLWVRLGIDYERSGRFDQAQDAYRHALDIAPTDSRARLSLERVNGRVKQ